MVPPMSHQVNLGSHWQVDQSRLHRQDQSSRGEGVPDHPTHDTIGGVHDNWELNRNICSTPVGMITGVCGEGVVRV